VAALNFFKEKRHLFWSERLQLQQIQNRCRIFFQEFLPQRIVAALYDFFEVLTIRSPIPGNSFNFSGVIHELLDSIPVRESISSRPPFS